MLTANPLPAVSGLLGRVKQVGAAARGEMLVLGRWPPPANCAAGAADPGRAPDSGETPFGATDPGLAGWVRALLGTEGRTRSRPRLDETLIRTGPAARLEPAEDDKNGAPANLSVVASPPIAIAPASLACGVVEWTVASTKLPAERGASAACWRLSAAPRSWNSDAGGDMLDIPSAAASYVAIEAEVETECTSTPWESAPLAKCADSR